MALLNFFRSGLSGFFTYLGQVALLAWETFCSVFSGRIRFRLTLSQIAEIGYGSQLIVIVTGRASPGRCLPRRRFFSLRA